MDYLGLILKSLTISAIINFTGLYNLDVTQVYFRINRFIREVKDGRR